MKLVYQLPKDEYAWPLTIAAFSTQEKADAFMARIVHPSVETGIDELPLDPLADKIFFKLTFDLRDAFPRHWSSISTNLDSQDQDIPAVPPTLLAYTVEFAGEEKSEQIAAYAYEIWRWAETFTDAYNQGVEFLKEKELTYHVYQNGKLVPKLGRLLPMTRL